MLEDEAIAMLFVSEANSVHIRSTMLPGSDDAGCGGAML
jgi:hypothetical protein